VVVVGAGQAGLSIAAQLTQLQVDTLIVDRERRIGDNWRNRYHALVLHNQVHVNHLPYMPFPLNWPTYIPKDKLAGWFEAYAESMELNCWTATEFEGGRYDEKEGRWSVTLRRADGTKREMRPRHVVLATGVSGIPSFPNIPTDFGEDGTGWQFKYLSRGGGYYFNVGCSDLIVKGEIGLIQFSDIVSFVTRGAQTRNGDTLAADLIVLATGYIGQEHLVRKLFGNNVAARVGPIWGFGRGQELRNMFVRTGQRGLWFIAGSLAQCRIYSKYLGLQIKALELGLLPRVCDFSGASEETLRGEYQAERLPA
jgi:hypothetical protein